MTDSPEKPRRWIVAALAFSAEGMFIVVHVIRNDLVVAGLS